MAVTDTLFDLGGAVFNVRAYGAKGDTREVQASITQGSTALTTASATFSSADTGRRVVVPGAGGAGATLYTHVASYTSATQVQLGAAAGTSVSGAAVHLGTDDTAALQAAIDAAHAQRVSTQPALGVQMVTTPPVEFPSGHYLISDAIDLRGYPSLVSPGKAIVEQTNPAKRIFYVAYSYTAQIRGLKLIGGTRQLEWMNPNLNEAELRLVDCAFQGSSDFAVWTLGSVGLTSPSASGTLITDVQAGATSIRVTNSGFFHDNQVVVVQNDTGEYHACLVNGISGDVLGLHIPIPSHWTGSAKASAGKPAKQGDFHLSANLSITRCEFGQCRKVLLNACDEALVCGPTWVDLTRENFDADSAAFVNLSGDLVFDSMFGEALMGTGGSRLAKVRWVDQGGWGFRATNSRFGGEDSGIPVIDMFTPPKVTPPSDYPYLLTHVLIEHSTVYVGALAQDAAVLRIRRAVPQLFVFRDNVGPAESPVIRNGTGGVDPGLDLSAYFPSDAAAKFRFQLGPMLQWASGGGTNIIPPELRPYADLGAARPLPVGPVFATTLAGSQAKATFRIPADVKSLQAIVTMSTCPNVGGSAAYRLTRSDVVSMHTSWNGSAITEYLSSTPLFVPTPPVGSGHSAPSLVGVYFGTSNSATRPWAADDRDLTVVYGNCTGWTSVSIELLHGSL